MTKPIEMSIKFSPELAEMLETMSEKSHSSKSDVLLKALYLMKIAIENKEHGNIIVVLNKKGKKISEIHGV